MHKITPLLFLFTFFTINTQGQSSELPTQEYPIAIVKASGDLIFMQNDQRLRIRHVVRLMKENNEAHQLIRSARSNNNWSYVTAFTGGGFLGRGLGEMYFNDNSDGIFIALVGVGMCVLSFALDRSYKRKAMNAVDIYNQGIPTTTFRDERRVKIGLASNGLGLALHF